MRTVELYLGVDTRLLPESRNRTSHLEMREKVPSYHYQLLSLAEVSHVATGVHAAGIVASPSLDPTAPGQKDVLYLPSLQEHFEGADGALH